MSAACPQLGFDVRFIATPELGRAAGGNLHDAFVQHIESRSLSYRGGNDTAGWSYVVWRDGAQADDLDREAVRRWAAEQSATIALVAVGLLVDMTDG
jgi:uncharacterized protein YggL (DUF469 family)